MHQDASECVTLINLMDGCEVAFDFGSDDVLLDIDSVCKKLSISRSSLERLRRANPAAQLYSPTFAGQSDDFAGMPPFPEPTIMLGRSPRWSAQVLNAWINGKHSTFGRF
jgi:predicted DNA-binding transcriptional regulator AlpA